MSARELTTPLTNKWADAGDRPIRRRISPDEDRRPTAFHATTEIDTHKQKRTTLT